MRRLGEAYPVRPITIIVPFPGGWRYDYAGARLGRAQKTTLGQPIVVETVGGASGSIGTTRVARAASDGLHVEFRQWASHGGSGATIPLQFHLSKDWSRWPSWPSPLSVVAKKDLTRATFRSSHRLAQGQSRQGHCRTVGVGSGSHMRGIDIQNATRTKFQFVPYRGGAPAMQDLVAGQVDFMCDFAGNSLPWARNGDMKPYVVMAKARWFAAPQVPTFEEMGIPGLVMSFRHGLWLPEGTPADDVSKPNRAVRQRSPTPPSSSATSTWVRNCRRPTADARGARRYQKARSKMVADIRRRTLKRNAVNFHRAHRFANGERSRGATRLKVNHPHKGRVRLSGS